MAEETLVKETLTKEMIQAGSDLTHRLDEAGLIVSASLWMYVSESNIWRIIISSPAVRIDGPKKIYQKIQSILSTISEDERTIQLKDVSVVADTDPLISLLRISLKTKEKVSGIRFSRNTINGHFIEDAYIYRIT